MLIDIQDTLSRHSESWIMMITDD